MKPKQLTDERQERLERRYAFKRTIKELFEDLEDAERKLQEMQWWLLEDVAKYPYEPSRYRLIKEARELDSRSVTQCPNCMEDTPYNPDFGENKCQMCGEIFYD